jgi:restriction system protein
MGYRRHARQQARQFAQGFVTWWASAGTGGIAFIVMYWALPALLAGNHGFAGVGRMSKSFAWLPLMVFGTLALFGLARSMVIGDGRKSKRDRRKARTTWRNTSVNISRMMVNHGWGVTRQHGIPSARPKRMMFDSWTIEALRVLEWKRFEQLCKSYYGITGFQSQTIRCATDGAIDVKLYKGDPAKPLAIVQCKTGNVYTVGAKDLRELLSMMSREKVTRGIFITTGTFNRDALTFAGDHSIQLLDGDGFLRKIQALSEEDRARLLNDAFEGDYKTPTCPACAIKMKKRDADGKRVWGCVNHPKCGNTFAMIG